MIVYDKNTFGSNREIDEVNGYLRVDECNISKCQVRPYLGREIPNWREFGLEADKIYNVYCPKEELEKAIPTFNNLPLTREHIEVDVDNVPKEKIVGSLGDHASFEYPYLKNNLIIYDKRDIDLVMSGKKKELSCGYRYTPVRQSGEAEGQHYDFVMTDIVGNHVALVKQGRAGRDVVVADSSKGILETIKEKIMAVFDNDLVGDEFKESEHPREKNGQFTSKGGSASGKKMDAGSNKKEKVIDFIRKNNFHNRILDYEDIEKMKELSKNDPDIMSYVEQKEKDLKDGKEKFGKGSFISIQLPEAEKTEEKKNIEKPQEKEADLFSGSEKKEESSKETDAKSIYEKAREDFIKSDEFERFKKTYSKKRGDYASYIDAKGGMFNDVDSALEDAVGGVDLEDGWAKNKINELAKEKVMYEWSKGKMTEDKKLSEAEQEKVGVVMKEFKEGELKSGSGEKVTDPKQAKAIALSEADKIAKDKEIPEKQDEPEKAGDEVALNKGEEKMADEVKKTPAEEKVEEVKEEKVTEDACEKAEDKEVKPACDEKEDKRKLIDEIGGILKDKLSEEEWRTVIKKAEELAYNDSEASADDEKCEEPKGEVAGDEEEVKVEEKEEEKAEEKEMAKDEALVMDADAIRAEAKAEVIADFKARETARRAVRKMVGDVDVFAFDSADEIYKFACEKAGMDLNEIVSFKDAFQGLSMAKASKLAMDASPVSGSDVECFKDIRLAY